MPQSSEGLCCPWLAGLVTAMPADTDTCMQFIQIIIKDRKLIFIIHEQISENVQKLFFFSLFFKN